MKLADETVQLVPGDPKLVQVVRQIFRRYFIDRKGFAGIAAELNRAKVPAPVGGFWRKSAIKIIIRNGIYTGVGMALSAHPARLLARLCFAVAAI